MYYFRQKTNLDYGLLILFPFAFRVAVKYSPKIDVGFRVTSEYCPLMGLHVDGSVNYLVTMFSLWLSGVGQLLFSVNCHENPLSNLFFIFVICGFAVALIIEPVALALG